MAKACWYTQKFKKPSYIFPLKCLSELHSFSGCFIPVLLHSSPGIFPTLKNLTQNAYYVTFIFFFWMKCFSKILFWFNLHFTTYYYRTLSLEQSHGMQRSDDNKKPKEKCSSCYFWPISITHENSATFLKFTLTIWIIAINTVK